MTINWWSNRERTSRWFTNPLFGSTMAVREGFRRAGLPGDPREMGVIVMVMVMVIVTVIVIVILTVIAIVTVWEVLLGVRLLGATFWCGLQKPSGCQCKDAFGGTRNRRVPTPLGSTSPFSEDARRSAASPPMSPARCWCLGRRRLQLSALLRRSNHWLLWGSHHHLRDVFVWARENMI